MSASSAPGAARGRTPHHVGLRVGDPAAWAETLTTRYGFRVMARGSPPGADRPSSTVAVRQGDAVLVLTAAREHPAPHGRVPAPPCDAVTDIALRVDDVHSAFEEAVARGAEPVAEPAAGRSAEGRYATAAVAAFGRLTHTFVEFAADLDPATVPWLAPCPPASVTPQPGTGLRGIDHFGICLPAEAVEATVAFYTTVFGYETVLTEHIAVGGQAVDTTALRSPAGDMTLVLAAPGPRATRPGLIEDFVARHDGPGVQHIALATGDIIDTVTALRAHGAGFQPTPDTYYEMLASRQGTGRHLLGGLRRLGILADQDEGGRLYQIFTRPLDEAGTFFLEIVERDGATTFGGNNIKALFETAGRPAPGTGG